MYISKQINVIGIFELLFEYYGPQGWWPGEDPLEICLGAILTQNTSWSNVEKALRNLRESRVCSVKDLLAIPDSALANLIYSSGYYNSKTKTIKEFVKLISSKYEGDLALFFKLPVENLRGELLRTTGIGNETADGIILYAAEKPTFVIDAYTRRIGARLNLAMENTEYSKYRNYFLENLPEDPPILNEFHALFVKLGKDHCFKRNPNCGSCPLLSICDTGRRVIGELEIYALHGL